MTFLWRVVDHATSESKLDDLNHFVLWSLQDLRSGVGNFGPKAEHDDLSPLDHSVLRAIFYFWLSFHKILKQKNYFHETFLIS